MRLEKIQQQLKDMNIKYTYVETDGLGSIDFNHRGLAYRVWEFLDGEYGAESNVANAGRTRDYLGDYESAIIDIMKEW